MPTQVYKNNSFSGGIISQDFSMQSILDVFVVQGLITHDDAEKLKNAYRTNQEIENVLIANKIVTKETINKAYSILLKLPYISLENTKIDQQILQVIPKKIATRFGVVAFGLKGNNLQIAISRPSELSAEFNQNIDKVMENKPYRLDLYITGSKDFSEVVNQYGNQTDDASKLVAKGLPVVYLRNQNLPSSLLRRLPLEFIEKHRAVIFYQKDANTFAMAAERPDSYEVRKAVEFIQKENKVNVQLFATSAEDIDYAIDSYRAADDSDRLMEKKQQDEADQKPQKTRDTQAEMEKTRNQLAKSSSVGDKVDDRTNQSASKTSTFSLGGFFSGFKTKNDSAPAFTIDTYEKVNHDSGEDNDQQESELPPPENTTQTVSHSAAKDVADVATDSEDGTNSVAKDAANVVPNPEDHAKELQEALQAATPADEAPAQPEQPAVTIEDTAQGTDNGAPSQEADKETEIGSLLDADIETDTDLKKVLSDNYIPKVVAAIINYALKLRSSDIHIEASAKDLRVRYRVDGILRDIAKLPLSMHPPIISRIKILSKMKIDETRVPQDGRFDVKFKNREVDVRVSALPTVHGEKMVLRVLDKDQGILSLEDLGMNGRAFDITVENIAKPYGIILSTGPTGSGKSTTLYAILNRISTPSVNIITLEDPVEYEISGVNQCQIKPAIGFTFAEGLRSVLRQDPNVVMVGEIRDGETAAMATHAALTGHLVLSTLHTNDSSGALPRLINMGIEPFLITSSINEIIAQRLVRRICPKCKEEMKVPQALMDEIKREIDLIPKNNKRDLARVRPEMKLYHGVGCPDCNQGYRGRVGLFEVLRMTEEVEELAIAKKSANEIKAAAQADGMITMRQDGILKCLEGATTIDEVFRATSN